MIVSRISQADYQLFKEPRKMQLAEILPQKNNLSRMNGRSLKHDAKPVGRNGIELAVCPQTPPEKSLEKEPKYRNSAFRI